MSLLLETIRIEDGTPFNLEGHNERLNRSRYELLGIGDKIRLEEILIIPDFAMAGLFKCRVEYGQEITKVEFIPYGIRPVNSLKIVRCNDISYDHKFTDRRILGELLAQRGTCDDIIIIRNGMVTDTSYSNLVLCDKDGNLFTPSTFLLAGTRRAFLLKSGLIREAEMGESDLRNYRSVRLINAMVGIEDSREIPIENIEF